MRYDLFSYNNIDTTTCTFIDMPDAEVYLYSSLFMCQEADDLFDTLKNNISWQQQQIKTYGQVHDIPRLTAWYCEQNKT